MGSRRGRNYQYTFNIPSLLIVTEVELRRRMVKAAKELQEVVKKDISRPNPFRTDPSKAGEPPKKVTGTLHDSIDIDVNSYGGRVEGFVGVLKTSEANDYAWNLEMLGIRDGTKRPFLRPALANMRGRISRILGV